MYFDYIDTSNPRAWCICSPVWVFFDFFHHCLIVFRVQVFCPLSRFIPRCFILFDAMVNGIVSLISFSDTSFLVYRNARDFSVLILYPVTLPITLVQYRNFWVVSLGFSSYCTMSSAKSNTFASSFPIWIPFIAVARTDCCG